MRSGYLRMLASVSNPNFIIKVKTDNTGTSNDDQMSLPISGTDITIDWGDGSGETVASASYGTPTTHTYSSNGTYTIKIGTGITQIRFVGGGDCEKLIEVANSGDAVWSSFSYAFWGCSNLATWSATDYFDTSSVTDMRYMFRYCSSLTSLDVSGFDTSLVTNMHRMFRYCSSLTSLDVSGFDTSSVTDMNWMFSTCSSLTSLDVSGFDTSSVTDMDFMFNDCSSLISLDVSPWNVTSLTDAENMFYSADDALSTAEYDETLVAWEAQAVQDNVTIHFGDATYTNGTAADTARQALVNDHSWIITDGGSI